MADYLSKTANLSILEHGAYTLLLDIYYSTEASLPADMALLHRLCRAMSTVEQQAVESIATQFFPINGDGRRHNARADKQIAKDRAFLDAQAEKSRLGVVARQSKLTPGSTPGSTQRSTPPTPTPTPTPSPETNARGFGSSNEEPTPKSSAVVLRKRKNAAAAKEKLGPEIWTEYSAMYRRRYSVDPVRNAKVNGQLNQLGKRLGAQAPQVAAWYVASNAALYVRSNHCVDLLLRDAEGLHTEWATGVRVMEHRARETDRLQTGADAVDEVAKLRGYV